MAATENRPPWKAPRVRVDDRFLQFRSTPALTSREDGSIRKVPVRIQAGDGALRYVGEVLVEDGDDPREALAELLAVVAAEIRRQLTEGATR